MKKAEDGYAVLTMNNCKQLLSKNLQQSAKEMFEVPFKYPIKEAVAVLLQC